jgi:[ribosomal protein S18]-alanine N-acetyltransferase
VSETVELRPTIDRAWLEREASREPLTHAFALWDLSRTPQAVRFVSARWREETVGYLLIWLGGRDRPVVHWYGPADRAGALVGAFPAPPFVAVVPVEAEALVRRAFPQAIGSSLKLMLRERSAVPAGSGAARRLQRADRPALAAFARAERSAELGAYTDLDPGSEPAWGVFQDAQLVGVARAAVRLPTLWVLGGVYVDPTHRARGLGRALVLAVVQAAERAGAACGLYVREEPTPAPRLYDQLGFREVGRRRWLDVDPPSGR